jgi:integrase
MEAYLLPMRFPEPAGAGAMKLNVRTTATLTLPKGKSDHIEFDDDIAGFGIRLRAGGSRTWIYQYRIGSKQRRMVLGSAKSVPLHLARENASKLEAKVRLGGDPAMDKDNARREASDTFGVFAERFLDARKSRVRSRTYDQLQRHLNKYARPLHCLPVSAISQRDIAGLLNDIAGESGDVTSNRVRSSVSALLSWTIKEGIRLPEGNIASHTNKREEKTRDRVLSDAELMTIWAACRDDYYGAIVKLLMLTGQRAREIAELRWDEVHDDQIVLPAERTKNHRSHVVPLSEAAKAILTAFNGKGRTYVFGRDDTGFQGWGRSKPKLHARISEACGKPLPHWTPHDRRRTVATRMAELGIQPHIVEAVLNHVSGHKGGVAGVYNRATYDKEKREALNLWAEHLTATLEGRAAVLVPLKRA